MNHTSLFLSIASTILLNACGSLPPTYPGSTPREVSVQATLNVKAGHFDMYRTYFDTPSEDGIVRTDATIQIVRLNPSPEWASAVRLCISGKDDFPNVCLSFDKPSSAQLLVLQRIEARSETDRRVTNIATRLPLFAPIELGITFRDKVLRVGVAEEEMLEALLVEDPLYVSFYCYSVVCKVTTY